MREVEQPAAPSADPDDPSDDVARGQWRRTSPLAVLYFLATVIKGLVANAGQMAASVGAIVVLIQQELPVVALGTAGLLLVCSVTAALRYWFFRFSLDADRVRIRQGVFKKVELNAQFDRIQGVHVEQSLIFRLLGLVTVGFDTAGSAQQEGKLPAVTPEFATALRERVERRKKAAAPAAAAQAPPAATVDEGECLVRLAPGDMFRIGLTDRSVLAGLVAVPLVTQAAANAMGERFEAPLRHAATAFANFGPLATPLVVVALLALCLLAIFALSTASAFLRYHDFRLFVAGARFRATRGLLTRKETAVERAKIQQLRLYQSALLRALGCFRLRAMPVSGGAAGGGAETAQVTDTTLHVPVLAAESVRPLAAQVLTAEGRGLSLLPEVDAFVGISPAYIEARVKMVGLAPALVAMAVLYPFVGAVSVCCLAWPALVALVAWQLWRRRGYMHTDDGFACRAGLVGFTVDAFALRKVQSILVTQSPLQRRRGLASMDIVLASGGVSVPYIDHATACRLRDYMLYKVEAGNAPWH